MKYRICFIVAVLQQAGRSPSSRMLTKYWKQNTGYHVKIMVWIVCVLEDSTPQLFVQPLAKRPKSSVSVTLTVLAVM